MIDVSKTNDVQENEIIYPQINSIKSQEILVGDIKGVNKGIFVKGRIEDVETRMLVDTCAIVTIISSQFYQTLKGNEKPKINPVPIKLISASGNPISVQGEFSIELLIENFKTTQTVIVADFNTPCILGLDFLSKYSCDLYLKKMKLKIQGIEIACFNKSDIEVSCCKISIADDKIIPPPL